MPLLPGSDKGAVGENVRHIMKTGKSQKQATTLALAHARKGRTKKPKKLPPFVHSES